MAGQADCRAVNGASCCIFWLSQSGHRHSLASSPFWCWRSNIASLLCIPDITPFWRCQTGLVLVLLCHGRSVDRIEENNKMVVVGLRLVSSQTRLLPTMTLYSIIILGYCRVQLKKSRVGACRSQHHVSWKRGVDTCRLIDFPVVASGQPPQPFPKWLGEANDQMLLHLIQCKLQTSTGCFWTRTSPF